MILRQVSKPMIRTQIELTEQQADALRELSGREQVPLSELVRRSIDRMLCPVEPASGDQLQERRRRALSAVGRFASGRPDGSERHDELAADAFKR